MAKYTIKDFEIGDEVYHLSNQKLIMVIIKINSGMNEVTCRWMDKDAKRQQNEFMPEELAKAKDIPFGISFGSVY